MAKKGMYILLSNSCLVLPAVVKQQQEEISHNHIPSFFAISVVVFSVTQAPHPLKWCLSSSTSITQMTRFVSLFAPPRSDSDPPITSGRNIELWVIIPRPKKIGASYRVFIQWQIGCNKLISPLISGTQKKNQFAAGLKFLEVYVSGLNYNPRLKKDLEKHSC